MKKVSELSKLNDAIMKRNSRIKKLEKEISDLKRHIISTSSYEFAFGAMQEIEDKSPELTHFLSQFAETEAKIQRTLIYQDWKVIEMLHEGILFMHDGKFYFYHDLDDENVSLEDARYKPEEYPIYKIFRKHVWKFDAATAFIAWKLNIELDKRVASSDGNNLAPEYSILLEKIQKDIDKLNKKREKDAKETV